MLTARLAAFEIRYQIRNPVFWVAVLIFFLLGFGMSASDNVSFGTPGSVHENSPYTVTLALGVLGTFYLFVITSFVANAVVRDDATGFGPMIRATPVGRTSFLAGRFLGGLAIAVLGYLAVPLGIALGAAMPWVDPETVGPGGFLTYAWPFLVIAIPNLILSSALLFSLATLTRSMLASYIGVLLLIGLAFVILNLVMAQTLYGTPSHPLTAAVIDTVIGNLSIFSLIVAVFYGGELAWRERDVKINEILDATPVPAWAMFVPKILAILVVLLAMSLTGMAAGIVYQLIKGAPSIDAGLYLTPLSCRRASTCC